MMVTLKPQLPTNLVIEKFHKTHLYVLFLKGEGDFLFGSWCLAFGTFWNYFLFWGRILLQWFAFIWTILFTMHPCSCSLTMWSSCCCQNLTRSWGDEDTPHQQTNIDLSIYFSDDSNLTLHRRLCVEIHGFAAFAAGLLSLHCCGRDWGELQHAAASTSIREQWEIQQWRCSGGVWLHCRRGVEMHAWWKRKLLQFRLLSKGMRLCFCFAGGGLLLLLPKFSEKTRRCTVHALHKKQLLHDNSSSQRSWSPRNCGWRSTHPNLGWCALPLAEAGNLLSVAFLRV